MRSKGFTLLEVIVSITILGFIMTAVWTSQTQTRRAKTRVEIREGIYHQGMVALRKMSDDIGVAFLAKPSRTPTSQAADTSSPDTTKASLVKTFFIGDDKGNQDMLRFTSLSHMRFFKNAREGDECKIAYELTASRDDPNTFELVRREEAWLDDSNELKADGRVVARGVLSLNIEYYDIRDSEWHKEWDTEKIGWQGHLPEAVRIVLSFANPNDERSEIELSTAVTLPLFRGPIEM